MTKFLYALAAIYMLLTLTGCNLKKDNELSQVYTGYTANLIYAKAHKQMKDHNYYDAIQSYKSLTAQYPFTSLSEKGMVDLVYVYYMNDESVMSLALAQQFIKIYPSSKYMGYVYYMLGVIGFENGRGILQTYAPYDMSYHDPANYIDAYDNFNKAISLNSNGSFVADAKRRMIFINNTIARHYNNIAHFYFKRGAFNAAIDRSSQVIRKYPQSTSTEDALILTIKAYNLLGLVDQAKVNLEVLKKNYPKSNFLKNTSSDGGKKISWAAKWFAWL